MNAPADLHANCATEPIHIPGSVQPCGALLVLSDTLVIRAASESALAILGHAAGDLLGRRLGTVLGAEAAAAVRHAADEFLRLRGQSIVCRLAGLPGGRALDTRIHVRDGLVMIDAEPAADQGENLEGLLHRAMTGLSHLRELDDAVAIAGRIAALVKALTGFDRVMVYRFDAAWNGEVVAECVEPGQVPFLGLHFPASDIPSQARDLYVSAVVRQIQDVHYTPSPILAEPGVGPIDLSDSCLRSVSPMHIQYLVNMGVRATLVGSVLRDGRLWGLLVCHQIDAPRPVAGPLRDLFQWICQDTSALISLAEARAGARRQAELGRVRARLLDAAHTHGLVGMLEGAHAVDLLGIVKAEGFALISGDGVHATGLTPSPEALRGFRAAVLARLDEGGVFASHRLQADLGAAVACQGLAGAIAVSMIKHHDSMLAWFRTERENSVHWGGNPGQAIEIDARGVLSPRNSFALFLEKIAGESLPWQPEEIEVARRLSEMLEIDLQRRMRNEASDSREQLRDSEDRLGRARERLEIATRTAEIGIWDWDIRSGRLDWDARMYSIFGVSPEHPETGYARWANCVHPEDLPRAEAEIGWTIDHNLPFNTEFRVVWPDGSTRHIRGTATVTRDGQGRAVRMVGCNWDVTGDREREQALRRFREHAESEHDLARFLLSRLSRIERLDEAGVAYYWKPAESFSGDVIAIARSSSGDLYGMLADATGHGLPAAINLVPLTSAFYAMAQKGFNLVSITQQMNKVVKEYSPADRFVALTLTRLLRREHQLEIINAGNPPALLIDGQRAVLRSFGSGSVPLGILDPRRFLPRLEVAELVGDESLLMFSDGLIEATSPDGVAFGMDRLMTAIAAVGDGGDLVAALGGTAEAHAASQTPADDVTVLQLRTSDMYVKADPAAGSGLRPPAPDAATTPEAMADQRQDWNFAITFSSIQLRRVDVVPVIVGLTRTLGLSPTVEARVFTILSELIANALDHGVLGLDSRIKQAEDGFERYFALRAERLEALREGTIDVRLQHWERGASGGHLRVEVLDTGAGFDYQDFLARLNGGGRAGEAAIPSGRGIALLRALCDEVIFHERGNAVTVEFLYD